jgi:hypothetical protein
VETSNAIDRAIAVAVVAPTLHLLSLDADILRWAASIARWTQMLHR